MKDRKKRGEFKPWKSVYFALLLLVFFTGFTLSTLRLFFTEGYHPQLVSPWRTPAMDAISGDSPAIPALSIRETVIFPDQAVLFLKYPPSAPFFTKDDIDCIYFSSNSSQSQLKHSPVSIDGEYLGHQIVRCPLQRRGFTVTVAVKSSGNLPAGPIHHWDALAYEAVIDRDNTTIVFVKGLNLRPGRVSNASRFQCVYGCDFSRPKLLLSSDVVSIAQEIVRCKTPSSILKQWINNNNHNNSIKVSIRVVGRGILKSIARPERRLEPDPAAHKHHEMCICTMLRNQARFLKEWVMYHSRIGVQRWFIYDNNSDDDIDKMVELLTDDNYNITRHVWPWIKAQEAGFAHCALRARDSCKWVGFIDVDEFFHLSDGLTLHNILNNKSGLSKVAELRISCRSFGPSGLNQVPEKGVLIGYTCRLAAPERHKSIVRPEALNSTLINMVHHFHLRNGFKYVNMNRRVMVINHYKYQVWEVFKEKFYRRVATYVFDWRQEKKLGSKDRVPGLGTSPVEPPDWSTRFCEVRDTDLRDRVLENFADPKNGMLPWQDEQDRFYVKQQKMKTRR